MVCWGIKRGPLGAAFALAMLSGVADAAERDASAEQGRTFAQRNCSGCHSVERKGGGRDPLAPAFRTLAARHDARSLRRAAANAVTGTHYGMPSIVLLPSEAEALAAYMRWLSQEAAARKEARAKQPWRNPEAPVADQLKVEVGR